MNRGYAKGGRAGFSVGRGVRQVLKKTSEFIKEHQARKEAKKVQAGKDEIRKSEMGYAKGGRAGFAHGSERKGAKKIKWEKPDWRERPKPRDRWKKPPESRLPRPKWAEDIPKLRRPQLPPRRKVPDIVKEHFKKRQLGVGGRERVPDEVKATLKGLRVGQAKGGKTDKKWIQKAVDPKHKGYCTPMTKKTCTPARKALARTFKKKAKTGWG